MLDPMKLSAILVALLALAACGGRREPERTHQGTRLDLHATTMTPQVHITPRDGGATEIQVGNARVQLPGEAERNHELERATQESTE